GVALRPKVETAGPPSAVEGDKLKLTASGVEMSARHHLHHSLLAALCSHNTIHAKHNCLRS
ncbi:unnamed protein product, partial [Closterium sp. NIES-54]